MSIENPESNQETSESKQEIPPQYEGMDADVVDELWVVPEYANPDETKKEKAWKEEALRKLREKEEGKK